MRLLLQRVSQARVEVEEAGARATVGSIGLGLLVLAGFGKADTLALPGGRAWRTMAEKLLDLRIFPDEAGKLNLSLRDVALAGQEQTHHVVPTPHAPSHHAPAHPAGGLLLVSQFTLYADSRRGRRPSFSAAAPPETARTLYDQLVRDLATSAPGPFAQGVFGAEMHLSFTNWGPVTILLDSADFEG